MVHFLVWVVLDGNDWPVQVELSSYKTVLTGDTSCCSTGHCQTICVPLKYDSVSKQRNHTMVLWLCIIVLVLDSNSRAFASSETPRFYIVKRKSMVYTEL